MAKRILNLGEPLGDFLSGVTQRLGEFGQALGEAPANVFQGAVSASRNVGSLLGTATKSSVRHLETLKQVAQQKTPVQQKIKEFTTPSPEEAQRMGLLQIPGTDRFLDPMGQFGVVAKVSGVGKQVVKEAVPAVKSIINRAKSVTQKESLSFDHSGKFLYHYTPAKNLTLIAEQGLVGKSGAGGVFGYKGVNTFFDKFADVWFAPGSKDTLVRVKAKSLSDLKLKQETVDHGFDIFPSTEIRVAGSVPANVLEVYTKDGWKSLGASVTTPKQAVPSFKKLPIKALGLAGAVSTPLFVDKLFVPNE